MFNRFKNKIIDKVNIISKIFNKKQWSVLIILLILSIILGS